MKDTHYVSEYGTEIIGDCGVDISSCNSCSIFYKKPDSTEGMWSGTTYTISGSTNYVRYVTVSGDIGATDQGKWLFQTGVTFTGGFCGRGRTAREVIYPKFDSW